MISVIIPTYKRSENLANAIESVLSQNGDFELIVVDDNDPNTEYRKANEKLIEKYIDNSRFTYIKHNKNKNGAAARNTGINASKGDYVTFLDDDDIFCDNRIKKVEEVIKKENPDFICTGVTIKKNGIVERNIVPSLSKDITKLQIDLLNQKSFFGTGSNIICKKKIVTKIKGFDEKFRRNQDIEFAIRILDYAKKVKCIPELLVIKNVDDYMNVPTLKVMMETKNMFLNKFSYILDKLPKNEKKEIIKNNYSELLKIAHLRGDRNDTRECKKYLKSINQYSMIDDIKIQLKITIKGLYLTKKIRSLIKK